jgi:hypothetical protein
VSSECCMIFRRHKCMILEFWQQKKNLTLCGFSRVMAENQSVVESLCIHLSLTIC